MSLFEKFKQKMESLSKKELDQFWEKYDAQHQDGPSAVELAESWGYYLDDCPPPEPKMTLDQSIQEALSNQGLSFFVNYPPNQITSNHQYVQPRSQTSSVLLEGVSLH